jgi:hypothetical protein
MQVKWHGRMVHFINLYLRRQCCLLPRSEDELLATFRLRHLLQCVSSLAHTLKLRNMLLEQDTEQCGRNALHVSMQEVQFHLIPEVTT